MERVMEALFLGGIKNVSTKKLVSGDISTAIQLHQDKLSLEVLNALNALATSKANERQQLSIAIVAKEGNDGGDASHTA